MARIGIISDIHSNLEALESVLGEIHQDGAQRLVHLGDLVGYNANPRECLHLLRARGALSILGNHDMAAFEPYLADSFNLLAHQALQYSREQLDAADLDYLRSMPHLHTYQDRYLLCHGTPENIQTYIGTRFQAKRTFNLLRKRFSRIRACFYGHTHLQKLWICDRRGKVSTLKPLPAVIRLDGDSTYLINPGSVGQPRQGDNRAHYLIFDSDTEEIHFKAVAYDIAKAQGKIFRARLPEFLALRLQDGV
jgi:diadenosine tetraphosphatase ApaH/serine/threonine PP2A family protein phosphatase